MGVTSAMDAAPNPDPLMWIDGVPMQGRGIVVRSRRPPPAPVNPDRGSVAISEIALSKVLSAPPARTEPAHIPPDGPHCPDCGGAGYYKEAVPYGHPHFAQIFPCRCKIAERVAHADARRDETLVRLRQEMGKLAECTFAIEIPAEYTPEEQRQLRRARDIAQRYATEPRGWLYLYGPTGVAKSHLAAAVANSYALAGWRVAYATVPALLRFVRSGFRDNSADERVQALMLVDLLMLDDLGTEYHAPSQDGRLDHANATLFEILDARCTYARPTVITSNMARADHEPRLASRIAELTTELYIDVPDYRELLLRRRRKDKEAL